MPSPARDSLPPAFRETLTERDIKKNSTLQSFDRLSSTLSRLQTEQDSIDTIIDIGCNRGGFAAALGEYLNANTVYGIDTDPGSRTHAEERGLDVFDINIEHDSVPLERDSVDLVLSFGLVEHLTYYDNLFSETARVLDAGWFWITTPNLGSWLNRFALLTGHQPRNVEISREHAAGVLPFYKDKFFNHVHAPTYKALIDLLEYYGFNPIDSTALTPYQRTKLDALLDKIFSLRTAWGRRVSVLSRQR